MPPRVPRKKSVVYAPGGLNVADAASASQAAPAPLSSLESQLEANLDPSSIGSARRPSASAASSAAAASFSATSAGTAPVKPAQESAKAKKMRQRRAEVKSKAKAPVLSQEQLQKEGFSYDCVMVRRPPPRRSLWGAIKRPCLKH
jgi:hypothetical protein